MTGFLHDWFLLVNIMMVRFLCTSANIFHGLLELSCDIPLYNSTTFMHSIVDEQLDRSWLWIITNITTLNILAHIFW